MRKTMRNALVAAAVLTPLVGAITVAQTTSKPATYITKEEIDTVNKTPGVDRTIQVVDIGPENFAVGIIHRGSTRNPPAGGRAGGGAARSTTPAAPDCGMLTGSPARPIPDGLYHESQTGGC
jgi:hypothetical protein